MSNYIWPLHKQDSAAQCTEELLISTASGRVRDLPPTLILSLNGKGCLSRESVVWKKSRTCMEKVKLQCFGSVSLSLEDPLTPLLIFQGTLFRESSKSWFVPLALLASHVPRNCQGACDPKATSLSLLLHKFSVLLMRPGHTHSSHHRSLVII